MEMNTEKLSELDKQKLLKELNDFKESLLRYKKRQEHFGRVQFTAGQIKKLEELQVRLRREYRWLKDKISKYGGQPTFRTHGINDDAFRYCLSSLHLVPDQFTALDKGLNLVSKAIERIESTPVVTTELKVTDTKQKSEVVNKEPCHLFDKIQFHPKVIEVSESLFKTENYAPAIFEAFKAVNNLVKEKSGLTPTEIRKMTDKQLMAKVFDESNPIIKLNELQTDTEISEQEGFKFLFMGATAGIRNPKAHDSVVQRDPYKTLEYLAFASLLMKRIDFWEAD